MQNFYAGLSGLFLGASLIIAIGAQNAFILRMGLLQLHVFWLCLICAASDALLIAAGIAGMGAFVHAQPALLKVIAGAGAAFLFAYALLSLRRAFKQHAMTAGSGNGETASLTLGAAISQALAFTWLNPHVYLDTVVLVGAYSATHEGAARIAFAIGAILASFLWFFSLGYGARLLGPLFAKPAAWRILDLAIAVVMAGLGSALLKEVFV